MFMILFERQIHNCIMISLKSICLLSLFISLSQSATTKKPKSAGLYSFVCVCCQIDDHIVDTARCRLDLDYGKILLKNRELEQNEVCV
jgi:hypothetical protein